MDPVTVSLTEEHIELLEELSADGGPCTNRSEAMRMIIDQYNETKDLQRENERLRQEKRLILEQREENTELMNYAETERAYREASLATRLKWWFRGRDRND